MALPKNPTQLEVVKAVNDKANDSAVVHKTGEETIQDHKTFSRTINGVTNQLSLNETQWDIFTCRDTTNPENKTAIAKGYVWCQDQNGDRYSQFKPEGIYYGKDSAGYEIDVAFPTDKSGSQTFAMVSDLPDISGKMDKSGGTFTGQVKFNTTSKTYNNGNIIGSKQADANTVPNLVDELRFTNGQMGSVNISTAYTLNNITVGSGWYNYIYIPHRGGGNSGQADGDNVSYGTLILKGMTMNSPIYSIRLTNGSIGNLDSTHTFTLSGTTLTIS